MPFKDQTIWEYLHQLYYVLFASIGSFMQHALHAVETDTKFSWFRATVEAAAAGFVGLLVMFLLHAMHINEDWTGFAVGISGWLGANTSVRIVSRFVGQKFHLTGTTEVSTDEDQEKK